VFAAGQNGYDCSLARLDRCPPFWMYPFPGPAAWAHAGRRLLTDNERFDRDVACVQLMPGFSPSLGSWVGFLCFFRVAANVFSAPLGFSLLSLLRRKLFCVCWVLISRPGYTLVWQISLERRSAWMSPDWRFLGDKCLGLDVLRQRNKLFLHGLITSMSFSDSNSGSHVLKTQSLPCRRFRKSENPRYCKQPT